MTTPRLLTQEEIAEITQREGSGGPTWLAWSFHFSLLGAGIYLVILAFFVIRGNNALSVLGALALAVLGCVAIGGGALLLLFDISELPDKLRTPPDYKSLFVHERNITFIRAVTAPSLDQESAGVLLTAQIEGKLCYYYLNTQDERLIADVELPNPSTGEPVLETIVAASVNVITPQESATPLLVIGNANVTLDTPHLVTALSEFTRNNDDIMAEYDESLVLQKAFEPTPVRYPPFHAIDISKIPSKLLAGLGVSADSNDRNPGSS